VNPSQLARLPTLLAYPIARYLNNATWNPMTLFLITEIFLIYTESLLRAQLRDDVDLKRPAGMGQRVERCLVMTNRLKELEREPLVEFVKETEENADLRLLISTRNTWVHSGPSLKPGRQKLDDAMGRLLTRIERVSIALVLEGSANPAVATALVGLSGLFGGPSILLPQKPDGVTFRADGSSLVAVPPEGAVVDLYPYLIYETGDAGENRVKLLTRIGSGKLEYLDPLEALGSR
jgi:hypothetical protein